MKRIEKQTEFECFCQICGIALYDSEVAGEIQGDYIDYLNRHTGEASIVFCHECWVNVLDKFNGGIEEAVRRRRMLDGR